MKEKRVYIVTTMDEEGIPNGLELKDICEWTDEEFVDEAESQGWVWSSMIDFAEAWNGNYNYLPLPCDSEMRIIEVETYV